MIKESGIVERLEPCPFCGADARHDGFRFAVVCTNTTMCGVSGPSTYDRSKGVERWNTRPAATLIAELQAERVDKATAWDAIAEKNAEIAEMQAERDRLNSELDASNKNHRSMAQQLAEMAVRLQHAESSLHRVRGETIEECAKVAESLIFPVLPDQMTTRELIKIQRDQISARIRSLNKTGLDSKKTAESEHSPSTREE